jgi:hypothetical protein
LLKVISHGADAYIEGRLTAHQAHIGKRCRELEKGLAGVGLLAAIDEATGYQYVREPDAIQKLLSKLLREDAADWEMRFDSDFYAALCRPLGVSYDGKHAPRGRVPRIIRQWIYEVIMPVECLEEIKCRKGKGDKCHQWLKSGGIDMLTDQQGKLVAIARSSVDYGDFVARCSQAFDRPGQQVNIVFPQAA